MRKIRTFLLHPLKQEIGYRARWLEKLIEFHSHPGYVFHRVHIFCAFDLEWNPLELENHEEIRVRTYTPKEALDMTSVDNRCDPEATLTFWLYAQKKYKFMPQKKKLVLKSVRI